MFNNKPKFISLLVVFFIIMGIYYLCALSISLYGSFMQKTIGGFFIGITTASIPFGIVGGLSIIAALSLKKAKEWARKTLIIVTGISILFVVISILFDLVRNQPGPYGVYAIELIVSILAIWYLMKKEVKDWCKQARSS